MLDLSYEIKHYDIFLICTGEAVSASEYYHLGRVTEFKYGIDLSNNKDKIHVSDKC